jgi:hypothetical protein
MSLKSFNTLSSNSKSKSRWANALAIALLGMSLTSATSSFAQSISSANDPATLAAAAGEDGRPFRFGGTILIETTRNANEDDRESFGGWYQLTANAVHKKTAISTSLRLGWTQEYTYQRDDGSNGSMENPSLSIAKSFRNGKDYEIPWIDSLSLSFGTSMGANREAARRSFLWSNSLTLTGTKSLGRFTLRQGFGYSRSFFEYDIRDSGVVNSPNTYRSTSSVELGLTDQLALSSSFAYAYSVSFQGVGRATQSSSASVDYMISNRLAASLGVAVERGTLEPDGQINRVKFFAPESAQYFFDLMISL